MTNDDYQTLARKTQPIYASEKDMYINAVMGLCGETGEACDCVKKYVFQGHDLPKTALALELGDIMWYVSLMCDSLGVTISDVMEKNIIKLKSRYPNGIFESERSVNRNE